MPVVNYIHRLWLEQFIFHGLRLLTLPARLFFGAVRSSNTQLDYETLLKINQQFPPYIKTPGDAEKDHQQKWAARAVEIANGFKLETMLEVGCGYGFASLFAKKAGKKVFACDIADVRFNEVKEANIAFEQCDVCDRLAYCDDAFDMIFSINSCEHFPDLKHAVGEMLRVTRPGGIIFLAFSPLYYSPWGLHASRRLRMPFPQQLFSESTIQRFVDEKKDEIAHTYDRISDKNTIGVYVNRYSIQQYRQVFAHYHSQVRVIAYVETVTLDGIKSILRYPDILKAQTPTFDDLIISGIKLVLQKKANPVL